MEEKKREKKENEIWNKAGSLGCHLVVGWMMTNVIFVVIFAGDWMKLEYVNQVPMLPFLLLMAVISVLSWFAERKIGVKKYDGKGKALLAVSVYLMVTSVMGLVGM